MRNSFLVLFLSIYVFAYSQNIDSLLKALKTAKHDTTKAELLNALIESEYDYHIYLKYTNQLNEICQKYLKRGKSDPLYNFARKNYSNHLSNLATYHIESGNADSGIYYLDRASELKKEIGDRDGSVAILINLGYVYNQQGDYKKALERYLVALELSKEIGNNEYTATCYNNMGSAYQSMGMIEKFNECAFAAMKLREKMGDQNGLYYSYNNIASYYTDIGDNDRAIEFYLKSMVLAKKMKQFQALARSMNNISICYDQKNDHETSQRYLREGYRISDSIGDKGGMALALGNLGFTLGSYGNKLEEGIELTKKSIQLWEEVGDKDQVSIKYISLGGMYYELKKYKDSEKYGVIALKIAREINVPKNIGTASALLKKVYRKLGKYKEALEMGDVETKMLDSLDNMELKKKSYQQGIKYEYEKKAAADSVFVAEEKKAGQLKLDKERTQKYALYFGLALVLIFAVFMFNRFRVTQRQKNIIQLQKHVVEEKQKEIVDSINYAKRIQTALLASDKLMNDNLQDHFVYYHPKDIVAGDFYWATNTKDGFIYVTADCTGHGVPGAFMSVLSITKLNESINQKNITAPDLILNSVRAEIISALNPEGSKEESKDGMDVILCKLDKKKMKLQYAAANNSFYIIRNNELQTYKADKMPVGKSLNDTLPFTLHEIDLQKGDVIYTLTDGYADQFGGPKGKKLRYKQLEELLLRINGLEMAGQRDSLNELFNSWKGNLEQVDDVCIIGVRV